MENKKHNTSLLEGKKWTIALMALMLTACDHSVVSQSEYDAAVEKIKKLEAENDSLQFENTDLKLYNDYLEAKLDSLQNVISYYK